MNDYYKNKIEEASEYQDFVIEQMLLKRGIPICVYTSKKNQYKAESVNGYEIKYDSRFRETKRLYIETHEMSNHTNKRWVESGILKNDNSKFILIGDYKDIFMFSKKQLRKEYLQCKWNKAETATSKGMFIDITENGELNKEFEFLCLDHIRIK